MFMRRLSLTVLLILFALLSTSTAGAAQPVANLDPATKGYQVTIKVIDIFADNLEEDCCPWSSDNDEIHFSYGVTEGGATKSVKPKGKVRGMLDSWTQVVHNGDHFKSFSPLKVYVTYGNGMWISLMLVETENYDKAKKYSDKIHKWAQKTQKYAEWGEYFDPTGISMEVASAAEFTKWMAKAAGLGTDLVDWLDDDDELGNLKTFFTPTWLSQKAGKIVTATTTFSGKHNGDNFDYDIKYEIRVVKVK